MLLTLLPKDKINIYHGKGEYFTPKISASASQKSDRFFFSIIKIDYYVLHTLSIFIRIDFK